MFALQSSGSIPNKVLHWLPLGKGRELWGKREPSLSTICVPYTYITFLIENKWLLKYNFPIIIGSICNLHSTYITIVC